MEDIRKNYSIDAIIAAFNEEEGIGLTLSEMKEHLNFENILVIDGNSRDKTVEIAKDSGAQILQQTGVGKGDAIAEGIKHIGFNVDYVVVTDADYTYPAKHVPEMIALLEANPNVGMVCGNRFYGKVDEKAQNHLFYFGNIILAWSHRMINGIDLKDPLTGLRVIRAEILRNWKVKSAGFDIEIELNSHVIRSGFKIVEVPICYRSRVGEKKLKARHGLEILKRIFLEAAYY
ncbi:glycosyltransferase family 2 protein [Candidatus Bathycorpusculum sp.]|uniref:glycosyltransferase family 2 protein n=1 Tax=Candidatus Bathycorpusculum sp. TaxID=2994959 RepID=UPI002817F249|nr:glycosyltransferase family 2 protein [Candidatus Termitimicrobium sp.]MCL2431587.1 glycosyltransferase family 2 protein [Candidatus Termitimicrobium sp.]